MNLLVIKALDCRDRALAVTRRLIRDERGDSLQWVMGLAIAATIIIALLAFGNEGPETAQGVLAERQQVSVPDVFLKPRQRSMSITARLATALFVGLAAAGLNALALMSSVREGEYVSLKAAVPRGELVSDDLLKQVVVPGDLAEVGRSLVPWKDRGLVLQMRASRDYATGDVILQRDLREAMRLANREELALMRFRVIAVGDRFKRQSEAEEQQTSGGDGTFVTIAVKQLPEKSPSTGEPEDVIKSRRMIRLVTQRAAGGSPDAADRIFGVAVFPRGKPGSAAASSGSPAAIEQPKEDEMLLTVPLEGIESVPDVILVGGDIGFFMLPEYP
jgi:hypothetical protein